MKAIDSPFTKIINGASQFVIPVFQRDYSWTDEIQCAQLWRDVLRAARTDAEHGHFLGSIVYIPTGDNLAGFTRWLVIDGQQRLTTLTLLLAALRDHIRDTKWTEGDDAPTPTRIDAYFLKNVQEKGDREQKLVLRRHDQATLRAIIDCKEMPEEPSERIRDNYEYFREQLRLEANPADIYRGIGRLVIVDVALDRLTDDPQLIFESLNGDYPVERRLRQQRIEAVICFLEKLLRPLSAIAKGKATVPMPKRGGLDIPVTGFTASRHWLIVCFDCWHEPSPLEA